MQINSSFLRQLPNDWSKQSLVTVCTLIKDGTHGTHPRMTSGIPLLSAKNVTEDGRLIWNENDSFISESEYAAIHRTYAIQPLDLLLTIVGSLGRRAIVRSEPRFTVQRSVAVIRPNPRVLSPAYLFHFAGGNYFQRRLIVLSNSTAQAGVYLAQLSSIEVALPPLPEQYGIAEILDTIDAAIQQTEALVAKLKRTRQGLMQDLLTCGIDEKGNIRSEKTHKFKDSPLGRIPDEWDVSLLDRLALRGSGHTPDKSHPEYWNGGIKWVSLADSDKLDNIYISETANEISKSGLRHSSAVLHPAGTVILSRDAGVGKSAILKTTMAVSQHFMAWRCGAKLNNRYLYYWLQRDKRRFEGIAFGSTIPTIGLPFFKQYSIAVPVSLREQDLIVERLLSSEAAIQADESHRDKLLALKRGLTQDLLTGNVRVPSLLEQ